MRSPHLHSRNDHVHEVPSQRLSAIADGCVVSGISPSDARRELDRRHRHAHELTCRMLDRFTECIAGTPRMVAR